MLGAAAILAGLRGAREPSGIEEAGRRILRNFNAGSRSYAWFLNQEERERQTERQEKRETGRVCSFDSVARNVYKFVKWLGDSSSEPAGRLAVFRSRRFRRSTIAGR